MKKLSINPETTLIIPLCKVTGGKRIKRTVVREEKDGRGRVIDAEVTTEIDDVVERRTAEAFYHAQVYILRKHAQHTELGYLTDHEGVKAIAAGMRPLVEEVEGFNLHARTCQVDFGVVPVEIAVQLGAPAARALAREIRSELEALRDAFRAGDPSAVRAVILRTPNLAALAVGVQAESITFALDEARDKLTELKGRIREGAKASTAGAEIDISMIEAGIGMFSTKDDAARGAA